MTCLLVPNDLFPNTLLWEKSIKKDRKASKGISNSENMCNFAPSIEGLEILTFKTNSEWRKRKRTFYRLKYVFYSPCYPASHWRLKIRGKPFLRQPSGNWARRISSPFLLYLTKYSSWCRERHTRRIVAWQEVNCDIWDASMWIRTAETSWERWW